MRLVTWMVIAVQCTACIDETTNVRIAQPDMRRAASAVDATGTATVRDEEGHAHDVDAHTEFAVLSDGHFETASIFASLEACKRSPTCPLNDPSVKFQTSITHTKVDGGAIAFVGLGTLAASAIGTLIAGNFACFDGSCADGVKGVVIGGDVLLGLLVVGAAFATVYAISTGFRGK